MKNLLLLFLLMLPVEMLSQIHDSMQVIRQVDSLIQLNRRFVGQRKFNEAIEAVDNAEKKAVQAFGQNNPLYATCLFNHGRTLKFKGDYPGSERYYLQAKEIREKILGKDHSDYAWSAHNLGFLYRDMGDYAKAEPLLLEAKDTWEKAKGKEHADYVSGLNSLALIYRDLGKYERSEPLYLEAKGIQEKLQNKEAPLYAMILNNLAALYVETGNYEKAELLYLESKNIREKVLGKEHPDYTQSLLNLANLFQDINKYEDAERLYLEAKVIEEKVLGSGHPSYAIILLNLARLYRNMGNFKKSELLNLETKVIIEKTLSKEHPFYAQCINNLAALYFEMGRYQQAEPFYVEAKAIREKTLGKEHPEYAQSLNSLASLNWGLKKYETAEALYLEAAEIRKKLLGEEHPDYAMILHNLGALYRDMHRFEKSELFYVKAKTIWEKTLGKEHPNYDLSLNHLAALYSLEGNYEKAKSLYLETGRLNRLLLSKGMKHLSENELGNYIVKNTEIYNLFFSFIASKGSFDPLLVSAAWNHAIFYKGLLLESARALEKSIATAPDSLHDIHSRLKGHRRYLAAEYSKPLTKRKNVQYMEIVADSLEKILVRSISGFSEDRSQATWYEVQAKLRPDEAAVEFYNFRYYNNDIKQTDSILYIALLLRPGWQSPAWVTLGEEKELQRLLSVKGGLFEGGINQLYAVRGIEPDSAKHSLKALYQFIWQPMDRLLQGVNTIYISPSGLLHYVNHNAIPTGAYTVFSDIYRIILLGNSRQLIAPAVKRDFNNNAIIFGGIDYNADSTNILYPGTYPQVASHSSLHFQNSNDTLYSDTWQYLSGTELEISELEKTLHKTGTTVSIHKGYAATEETFKRIGQTAPSPRMLHIATHGFFFPDPKDTTRSGREPVFKVSDHPMLRSGLLLAGANHAWARDLGSALPRPGMEDGILTAYEVSQMNLSNTELVVLSACETGLGDIQGNEGVYGLQRAFKIAGAKYLIMSLWQVPDKETSEFMATFYKKWLEDKMEIPEAFRAAQKEMRRRGFDPYQWAAFVLVE